MSFPAGSSAAPARALVVEPETLLLDEPLSNLDTNLREEMRYEIRRLHDEFRYTTVYVTHDQSEAMTTADRVVVMNGGRVEQIGTPEELIVPARCCAVHRGHQYPAWQGGWGRRAVRCADH